VTRRFMNGDFKRPHRYTDDCRVCPRSRVNACLGWDGALPSEPIPSVTAPLVFEQRCERTISRSLARLAFPGRVPVPCCGGLSSRVRAGRARARAPLPPLLAPVDLLRFSVKWLRKRAPWTSQRSHLLSPPTTSQSVFPLAHRFEVTGVTVLRLS